jgi:hypothetical protein
MKTIKFDWDDFTLYPTELSEITTRKSIQPYINTNGKLHLPLMTAPMTSVISDEDGFDRFNQSLVGNNIPIKVLERSMSYEILSVLDGTPMITNRYGDCILSVSLEKIESLTEDEGFYYLFDSNGTPYIKGLCIDVANGHMEKVWQLAFKFKEVCPQIEIMIGNIANPNTLKLVSRKYGDKLNLIDYIRVGIGYGGACLTSVHTGIGYPMASLIHELFLSRENDILYGQNIKIVADGGFKNYSEIIKALFLGADYVMLGGIFAKTLNTSGEFFQSLDGKEFNKIDFDQANKTFKMIRKGVYKLHYGMSSKEAQKRWGNYELKTSEGVVKYIPIEYTTPQWLENFESYLRSSMSYLGIEQISDFIGGVGSEDFYMESVVFISENSLKRFSK